MECPFGYTVSLAYVDGVRTQDIFRKPQTSNVDGFLSPFLLLPFPFLLRFRANDAKRMRDEHYRRMEAADKDIVNARAFFVEFLQFFYEIADIDTRFVSLQLCLIKYAYFFHVSVHRIQRFAYHFFCFFLSAFQEFPLFLIVLVVLFKLGIINDSYDFFNAVAFQRGRIIFFLSGVLMRLPVFILPLTR